MSETAATYAAPNRFEIDAHGMRALNGNREPWDILKELIQNAWDEAPEATVCKLTTKQNKHGETVVVVEDDGAGFANPRDSYTLLGDTAKRRDPKKRGRFNIGEKEAISVAFEATIETVGQTIEFPRLGGRAISPNDRERGTRITLVMPWTQRQMDDSVDKLSLFRPTDCALTINRRKIPTRKPLTVRKCTLPTVLQNSPGEPIRNTRRKTEIHILALSPERKSLDPETRESSGGWIFEMGIPIQPISTGYDVDVLQKVPMPPNRTTVSESYLKDIYAELLNAMADMMDASEFTETWARTAVENERRAELTPVRNYFENKYGEKSLIMSSNANSNMKAVESGFEIINPRSLSPEERSQAKKIGMQTTHQLFGQEKLDLTPVRTTDEMDSFAEWVVVLAKQAGIESPTVSFIYDPTSNMLACCTANRRINPTIRFNTALLEDTFFSGRGQFQYEIIVHELAHAWQEKEMEHGPSWGNACCTVASKLLGMSNPPF